MAKGFLSKIEAPASVAAEASLRLPQGTAPTSPQDGDVWTTSAGMYVRIGGVTTGPLGVSGGGGGGSGEIMDGGNRTSTDSTFDGGSRV